MPDINCKVKLEGIPFQIVSIGGGLTGYIRMHTHSLTSYEIHYIVAGKGVLRLQHEEYHLKAGTFYLTGPGIAHEQIPDKDEPMEELCMYYTVPASCIEALTNGTYSGEQWVWQLLTQHFWIQDKAEQIGEILGRMKEEAEQRPAGYLSALVFLAGTLLVYLGRLYQNNKQEKKAAYIPPSEEAKYLQIERIFMMHFASLTIDELAKRLGIGVRQLQRLMKKRYGITFRQMQMNYRMENASGLLRSSGRSIAEIAEQSGFSSADYFGYCFKQVYGVTPGEYRKGKD